jgi:hypothetical protein
LFTVICSTDIFIGRPLQWQRRGSANTRRERAGTSRRKCGVTRRARRGRGGKGGKVKSRKQAIAIGLSKARKEGKRVPRKKK